MAMQIVAPKPSMNTYKHGRSVQEGPQVWVTDLDKSENTYQQPFA